MQGEFFQKYGNMGRKWKSSEQSRQKILEGAARAFGQKGFFGTSIRDISLACGLSLPSMYHHFKDKEDLYSQTLGHVHLSLTHAMQTGLVQNQDLKAEIRSIFEAVHRFHKENPLYIYLLFSLTYAAPENIQKEYGVKYSTDLRDLITRAFRRHRPTGRVRSKMTMLIALLNNHLLDLTAPADNRKGYSSSLAVIDFILD